MKYLYLMLIIVIGIFNSTKLFAQNNNLCENYYYGNFVFAGSKSGEVIFQFFPPMGEKYEKGKKFDLYKISLKKDERINLKFYKKFDNNISYINNKYLLYMENEQFISLKRNNNYFQIDLLGKINIYRKTHYQSQGDHFYFSTEINKINYLAQIDLSAEKPKIEVLPIKGRKPILYKNWLFYEIDYVSPKYSDPPESIYRVRIGDWRNPELVVNDVYSVGTVVNENIISFRIYLDKEMKHVTYNMSDSTYIEKGISSLIKYKGKKYQRTLCKNPETSKTQLCFKDLPDLPEEFPHKLDRDIEANHNYFHLPHTEKPFTGTFITDSLMFFADKEELQKLSKPQLRKLRNAFYAREGYDFNSRDLKEFFSQYEWYINTLERRKAFDLTNNEIYMPPANMERIRLIQSVEKSK